MDELRAILNEYKIITEQLFDLIDNQVNQDDIDKIINRRWQIIELIKKMDVKEDVNDIFKELDILKLDDKVEKKIKKEMAETKKSLKHLRKMREARKSFTKREGIANFFDAKG